MTATPQLTTDLQKLVLEVEDDLRARLDADPASNRVWHEEHEQAVRARRTAMAWTTWRDDRIVQAAVSWVLTTVFIRFAEDNELIAPTWFTGPGERRHHAVEAQQAFFREHPELTDREWIEQSFEHLRSIPATAGLVDEHAGLRLISPSGQMATRILEFWRRIGDDGALVHDLSDLELSTRFLGDLYQDLSEHARETFALLQTPEFVEEFILDQTLTPALKERPLEGFKLIDPTCGSGHFLLGAFARFNGLWAQKTPSMGARERVQKALESVYGVDINAFAVAVARFRLTIAALQACGERSLDTADAFDIHVETGDSLIHGKAPDMFEGFSDGTGADLFAYATEDQQALREILAPGQYDVVVGNPPYITVKDVTLNQRYREIYPTCHRQYALTVPFMERFYDLAKRGSVDRPAGWTGQITSNSFMKREFGTKLIENFLSRVDVQLIVDTSGAYIPGHGTPTVILVGRHDSPRAGALRAILGIRGEPGRPRDASRGLVWSSIVTHLENTGFENEWISVSLIERQTLRSHPWSLQGGAAPEIQAILAGSSRESLGSRIQSIGRTTVVGEDDGWFTTPSRSRSLESEGQTRVLVTGEVVRDYGVHGGELIWWPYNDVFAPSWVSDEATFVRQVMWPLRAIMKARSIFGQTLEQRGRPWFDHLESYPDKLRTPLSIVFAFVATHNHFALERGGKVFKQSAPVIKLPQEATEEECFALLGTLNSSVACFWLKMNSHDKGRPGAESAGADEPWEHRYEFTGTTLQDYPLPDRDPLDLARALDELAQARLRNDPRQMLKPSTPPTPELLEKLHRSDTEIRERMIFLQEELDWWIYSIYGLTESPDLIWPNAHQSQLQVPIKSEWRSFAVNLAQEVGAGRDTSWFSHWNHKYEMHERVPLELPADYRELVKRRIEETRNNRLVGALERPEYKRRWAEEPWETRRERALRAWLLDRIETREHWFDPKGRPLVRSIGQLADALGRDENFVSVLELWAGHRDVDLVTTLTKLLADEVVPYLAAWRLKEPALRKWEAWKTTWDFQRREDKGEDVGPIPVPPKYTTTDFRKQSYWSHRGKLDVPKERFVVYPEAELSTDRSMLLGWAGWNHAEQFLALASHMDRMIADGAGDERLVPVLAGLDELMPWVQQWHAELDPAYGVSLGDFAAQEVEQRRARLGVSFEDLVAWRPPKATRGRRKKTS